jgi:hypothetical protein
MTTRGRRGPLHPPPRLPQFWKTSWCRRVSAPTFPESPLFLLSRRIRDLLSYQATITSLLSERRHIIPSGRTRTKRKALVTGIPQSLRVRYLFIRLENFADLPFFQLPTPSSHKVSTTIPQLLSRSRPVAHYLTTESPLIRRSPSGKHKTRGSLDLLGRNAVGLLFFLAQDQYTQSLHWRNISSSRKL